MIIIPVSKEWNAEVEEPTRGDFADNLGGAIEYSSAHFVYKVLEMAGGAIGTFLAGSLVKFLEGVEPHMVHYVAPLIRGLLELEGLPDWFREFLEELQNPSHEVGAALLSTLSGSVVSGATGSVFGALFARVVQNANQKFRPTIPDPSTLLSLGRRGLIPWEYLNDAMARLGYPDAVIETLNEGTRPRLDLGALTEGIKRGTYSPLHLVQEMEARGFPSQDRTVALGLIDNLLDLGSIMTAYYRQTINRDDAKERMSKLGYTPQDAEIIFQNSQVIPGVSDLVQMAVREAWRDDIARDWGYDEEFSGEFASWAQKQGLDPEWSKRYWRAHWQLPSVSLGFQMYHRKIISRGELDSLLKTADYPAGWRGKMVDSAYSPITRVDVRRFYRLGIFDYDELVRRYEHLGYSPEDAKNMADFTKKFEDEGAEEPTAEARNITRTLLEKAYRVGKLTREEAAVELGNLRYTSDHVELMLSLVDITRELDQVPDFLTEYRNDMQNVILKSYTKRMLGAADVTSYLVALGFDPREAELKMLVADFAYSDAMTDRALDLIGENYVRRTITRTRAFELIGGLNIPAGQQEQIFAEWDLNRNLRTRKLTEAQYRKAAKDKLITVEEYAEQMRGLGYAESDVELLVQMGTVPEEE